MTFAPELLLVSAVVAVGVLHTIVPDHWVPITLLARQQGWSRGETARAALQAGSGHVVSTLALGLIVWIAGVAFATKFGHVVSIASSLALIGFGGWIAIGSWREMKAGGHGHNHSHGHTHGRDADATIDGPHGSERNVIAHEPALVELSIFERGVAPRFRLTGPESGVVRAETVREDGAREAFTFANLGLFWESDTPIPEPHAFRVELAVMHGEREDTYSTRFEEHEHHVHDEPAHESDERLYLPLRSGVVMTHVHLHRHGERAVHAHRHDHDPETAHVLVPEGDAPVHDHGHKKSKRTALLLILGSSPMVEGIPAFFAAGRYGIGLIAVMAVLFAFSTIATYVVLCVYSVAGLQRVKLGALEAYGEVLSGVFIALIGIVFLFVPVF